MKLAILHSGDLVTVSPGGMDQYVKNIITGLLDCDVTLFGVSHGDEFELGVPANRRVADVEYRFVPLIDDSKYPLCPRFMKALKKHLDRFASYDCIFAQRIEYSLPFAFSPLKKRLVQIVHGSSANAITHMSPLRACVYLLAERLSVSISRKTIVILKRDDSGMPYYQRRYSSKQNRFVYNHIPVDLRAFNKKDKGAARRALGISENEFVVAYCGRVEDMPKRVLLFPDISRMLDFPHRFLVIGDGSDVPTLRSRCEELGVADRFIFGGYVDNRFALADKISASDVTLNISTDEGTCTSVLESLACGVPVVSTDAGDINELVRDGKNGIVVANGGDRYAVAERVAKALTSIRNEGCPLADTYSVYGKEAAIRETDEVLREVTEVITEKRRGV